jgi:signal transduction histidine kinase
MPRLRLLATFFATVAFTALTARTEEIPPMLWSGWFAPTATTDTIAAVTALPDKAFHTEPLASTGEPPSRAWVRIKVRGAAAPSKLALLEIGTRYEDVVELFVTGAHGEWEILRSGEAIGPQGRAWPGVSPVFPVHLPARGGELVVHARLSEHRRLDASVTLHLDPATFTAAQQREITENMLYFGLLAALFAYNFFLYLRLRYRDLLYYLIYLACFGATMLIGTYTVTLLLPLGSPLRESVLLAALNGSLVALLLFVREFHELPGLAPRLARTVGWTAAFFSVGLLAPAFDYQVPWVQRAFTLNFLFVMFGLGFVPVIAVLAWRQGARQARFFLLAFSLYLAGLIAILLEAFGLTLPPGWAERLMRLGSAAEMLLLAFAISDRFRRIRVEKEALQTNYTVQLERDVATRTRELQDTAARLAASNADKDQLVAIIAHDVRTPLVSLLTVARSLHAAAPAEAPALAQGIAHRTGTLLALINNLLDWARLHTGQFRHDPAPFELAGIANSVVSGLAPLAAEKEIRLEMKVPDALLACADLHAVQCVLRNLVGNALKFTPAGGRVRITATPATDSGFMELSVRDTGPGLPSEMRDALETPGVVTSTPGTAGERGAGIGLALCRELVAREGGTLTFACPPEGGTIATVRLPTAALSA